MKSGIDVYFNKLSKEKLIKIYEELVSGDHALISTINIYIINEFNIDPLYATTVVRNKVHEILSRRYIKELKKKINESKKN